MESMKLAWCTDIHLNFLELDEIARFCHAIVAQEPDALLVTGDISEAPGVCEHLALLAREVGRTVYFVLGNHDYYRGGIHAVRGQVRKLCASTPELVWMPSAGVVPLGAETALVGHDGWADGRLGDFARSRVMLNDYLHIDEIAYLPKLERLTKLHALGDEAAEHMRAVLPGALDRFSHVVVATHVPPFREACVHEGRVADDDWLPHFSCKAVGDALKETMETRPDRRMTVLCGHTHGEGTVEILPNLVVHTGGAEYGAPAVQRVLEL
jgi:3',5'-cyclic AMP phosphodiesterase CpdA